MICLLNVVGITVVAGGTVVVTDGIAVVGRIVVTAVTRWQNETSTIELFIGQSSDFHSFSLQDSTLTKAHIHMIL